MADCENVPLAQNSRHIADGLARLIEQYRGKPRLEAYLTSFLRQVQDVEDAAYGMTVALSIDNAVGVNLDLIGKIVGRPRAGLSDAVYRTVLRAQIKANRSPGNADAIIEIMTLLAVGTGESPAVITFTPHYPAAFSIALESDLGSIPPELVMELLTIARAGGVRITFVYTTEPRAETFAFADGSTPTLSSSLGFGTTTSGSVGGKLSSARSA